MVYKPPAMPDRVDEVLFPKYVKAQAENDESFWSYSKINPWAHNQQRPDFFVLLKRIKEKNPEMRLPAMIHEYINTEDVPKIPFTKIPLSNGSMMHKVLHHFLRLDKPENELSDAETYIYIQRFHRFVADHIEDDDVKDLVWKTKANLLAEVHKTLAKVNNKMAKSNDAFFHSIPDVDALIDHLKETITAYSNYNDNKKDFWGRPKPNLERTKELKIWLFVLETATKLYPFNKENLHTEPVDGTNYANLRLVLAAVQLATFQIIDDSCRFRNNSVLCRIGLPGINQDHINAMDPVLKLFLFAKLHDHLIGIQQNGVYFKTVKKQWQELGIPNFLEKLAEAHDKVAASKNAPGMLRRLVGKTLGVSAGLAAGPALFYGMTLLPLSVAGIPGFAAMVTVGTTLYAVPIGYNVGDKLTSYLIGSSVKTAKKKLGACVESLVTTKKEKEILELFNINCLTPEEIEVVKDLVAAWLDSPEDIITPEMKNHLRVVKNLHKGLEKEELPKTTWFTPVPI